MAQRILLMRSGAVASAAALVVVALLALVPFEGAAQTGDSPGISVATSAAVQHRTPIVRPAGVKVFGIVLVDATLSATGEVTDARVLSGPEELKKAVQASVLQWHFAPTSATARVTVTFADTSADVMITQAPPPPPPPPPPGAGLRGGGKGAGPGRAAAPPPVAPPFTFANIVVAGVSPELEQQVRQKLGFTAGQTVNKTLAEILASVREVDQHLVVLMNRRPNDELWLNISLAGTAAPGGLTAVRIGAAPAVAAQVPSGTPRVATSIMSSRVVTKVAPVYPPIAKQARIQGVVKLDAVIGADGRVQSVQVLEGPAVLIQAAVDAVQQWVYTPTQMNGQATAVVTTVEVNFTLLQ